MSQGKTQLNRMDGCINVPFRLTPGNPTKQTQISHQESNKDVCYSDLFKHLSTNNLTSLS